jgi:diacylglycerol kinase
MGEHAAGAVEDAISLVQAAIAGIQQAAEHERVFRQGVQAAAQRHGG